MWMRPGTENTCFTTPTVSARSSAAQGCLTLASNSLIHKLPGRWRNASWAIREVAAKYLLVVYCRKSAEESSEQQQNQRVDVVRCVQRRRRRWPNEKSGGNVCLSTSLTVTLQSIGVCRVVSSLLCSPAFMPTVARQCATLQEDKADWRMEIYNSRNSCR